MSTDCANEFIFLLVCSTNSFHHFKICSYMCSLIWLQCRWCWVQGKMETVQLTSENLLWYGTAIQRRQGCGGTLHWWTSKVWCKARLGGDRWFVLCPHKKAVSNHVSHVLAKCLLNACLNKSIKVHTELQGRVKVSYNIIFEHRQNRQQFENGWVGGS